MILVNETSEAGWIQLRLIGKKNNRDGIGSRIEIKDATGKVLVQQLCGGTSYCSSHEQVLTFGAINGPVSVGIRWPNGTKQQLDHVNVGQELIVVEP